MFPDVVIPSHSVPNVDVTVSRVTVNGMSQTEVLLSLILNTLQGIESSIDKLIELQLENTSLPGYGDK